MGFGGISIWQLLIVLAIIVLLFGTKKLRNIGSDLGNAVRGFKKALNNENELDDLRKNDIGNGKEATHNIQNDEAVVSSKDTAKVATDKQ